MDLNSPQFQASQVGILGALRTGNPIVDMMLAMLVPIIIKKMFDQLQHGSNGEIGDMISSIMFFWSPYYTRDIEHKAVQVSWGGTFSTDKELRNNVLIKAITLYLDQERKLEYRNSSVNLQSTKNNDSPWPWDRGEDDQENTPAGKLKSFKVAKKPPKHRWCPVSEKGAADKVEIRVVEHEHDKGEKAEKTTLINMYQFRSRHPTAIDNFIETCYKWYIEQLKKMEDNSRYLYEMQVTPDSDSANAKESASRVFKRYKLSDAKTFKALFFDEKKRLLAQIEHFKAKSGKYAVSGYPHKLGLLLHGPPGTGKTSLIKALAQHTGRSIVNVPLARIATNQELMDIMFDQSYMVAGDDVPIKLGFKDVIFVMEDVDAAAKIVQRRDGKKGTIARLEQRAPLPPEEQARLAGGANFSTTPWGLLLACDGEDEPSKAVRQLVEELMEKSERLKAAAVASDNVVTLAAGLRVPKPPTPRTERERDELEKKSPMERADFVANKVKESMGQRCERKEAENRFAKTFSTALSRALKAGAIVDTALEDELLGVTPSNPTGAKAIKDHGALGYDGGATGASLDNEEEQEDSGLDMQMMMAQMLSLNSSSNSNSGGTSGSGGSGGLSSYYGSAYALKRDKLNLSGLLNVLDGVVDTPERIVVMTTNHPEILDPALIRPGRIDQRILLGYMKWHNVVDMINHYFQLMEDGGEGLSAPLVARVRDAILGDDAKGIAGLDLTPAQVEQLSAENDTVEEMIVALERKAPSVTDELNGANKEYGALPPARQPSSPLDKPMIARQGSKAKVVFE